MKISTIILNLFIIIFFFSCKEEIKTNHISKINYRDTKLIFPDTVYVNESNDGRIEYKNDLDTITTKFDDLERLRFLYYEYYLTKEPIEDNKEIRKMVTDTFVAESNRLIPLYDIKFNKLGLNYFNGIITDEVIIAKGGILKDGSKGDRIITNEIRLTQAVYVIERKRNALKQMAPR